MPSTNFFIIGDLHIRTKFIKQYREFKTRLFEIIEETNSSLKEKGEKINFFILLGDTLDTNDVAKNLPFLEAEKLFEELSSIAYLIVLIGNHDYSNPNQYLTNNHFFNPFKKWKNVRIVDGPFTYDFFGERFVCMPYVPPGRFEEALNNITDWKKAIAIFAHQGFVGSHPEAIDEWSKDYPPVFTGHIHNPSKKGNVWYCGSPMQIAFDESPDKYLHLLTINKTHQREKGEHRIKKFLVGLKNRKTIKITSRDEFEKIEEKIEDDVLKDKYDLKIILELPKEEISGLKRTKLYKTLNKKYKIESRGIKSKKNTTAYKGHSYDDVFNSLITEEEKEILEDVMSTNFFVLET